MPRKRLTVADQIDLFWSRVEKGNGCWEWRGGRNGHGYGGMYFNGRVQHAHRVSWQIVNGPIPRWQWILHSCDNKGCVNPAHLDAGTASENLRQAIDRGLLDVSNRARGPNGKFVAR